MTDTLIITGAAGNLGMTLTQKLLEKKYKVHALISPDGDDAFLTHQNLNTHKVDLLNPHTCNGLIQKLAETETVGALICLVGAFTVGTIENTEISSIQKMIDLNFTTLYNVVRPVIKQYSKNKKPFQIIMIGSRPALMPEDGKKMIAYSLSKSLVFRMAEFINEDCEEHGVRASIIVPSTIDTPDTRKAIPDANHHDWVTPVDIAETINFILSETGLKLRQPVFKLYNKA